MSKSVRNTLLVVLTLFVAIALVACGSSSDSTSSTSEGGGGETSGGGETVDPTATPLTDAKASEITDNANPSAKIGLVLWAPVESEQTVQKEIEAAASDQGWEVQVTQANGSADAARKAMETYLQTGVDGIINLATDNASLTQIIAEAQRKELPFVSMFVAPTEGVVNVSPSTWEDISTITDYIIERTGGSGEIGVINTKAIPILREREELFEEFLTERAPDLKIVARHELSFEPSAIQDAKTATSAMLGDHPNLSAVWSSFDDPATGAAQAIKAAGKSKTTFATGIDGDSVFVQQMGPESPAAATILFNFRGIAQQTIWVLNELMLGNEVPRGIWFNSPLLTETNLSEIDSLVGSGIIPCSELKVPSESEPCGETVGVGG